MEWMRPSERILAGMEPWDAFELGMAHGLAQQEAECPYCKAAAGAVCTVVRGAARSVWPPHLARINVWRTFKTLKDLGAR